MVGRTLFKTVCPPDTLDRQLADSLFHLHNTAPAFFEKMLLLNPIDNSNDVYQLLQLFLMFLQEDNLQEDKVTVTEKTCKAHQKTLTDAMRDTG
jgi:hypothetical protein